MTEAERFPNGDLQVPFARDEGGVLLDGFKRVAKDSDECKEWERAAKAEGVQIPRARLLGQDALDSLTSEEQDAKFGPDLATALRDGKVALADIVTTKNGFLVRKPIDELNLPQDQNS